MIFVARNFQFDARAGRNAAQIQHFGGEYGKALDAFFEYYRQRTGRAAHIERVCAAVLASGYRQPGRQILAALQNHMNRAG